MTAATTNETRVLFVVLIQGCHMFLLNSWLTIETSIWVLSTSAMQFGLTALHHAALRGQVDTIRLLVQELHADPDISDFVS